MPNCPCLETGTIFSLTGCLSFKSGEFIDGFLYHIDKLVTNGRAAFSNGYISNICRSNSSVAVNCKVRALDHGFIITPVNQNNFIHVIH